MRGAFLKRDTKRETDAGGPKEVTRGTPRALGVGQVKGTRDGREPKSNPFIPRDISRV